MEISQYNKIIMKRILFLICCTSLLTSCGLFRKTTREKSVVHLQEKRNQLYVDTTVIVEQSSIDTTIQIQGTDETITYVPVDYTDDSTIQTIENDRYIANFQYIPHRSMVKASVKLKSMQVPVKMDKQRVEKKNITWADQTKAESKQVNKQTERIPSVNWNWVIPACLGMLFLLLILFIKIKKRITL